MDKELSFNINKDGKEIECKILALINGENENESYIAFCYANEVNNYVQYAKVIKNNNEYSIEDFENEEIVNRLMSKIIERVSDETFSYLENNYE